MYEEHQRASDIKMIDHFFEMDRFNEAKPYIEKLLYENPKDAQALYYMAVVYLMNEEYEQSREFAHEAIQQGYDEAFMMSLIGTAYQHQKRNQESEQAFLRALELEPSQAQYHAQYGHLMLVTGQDKKAMKLLEEALRLDPDHSLVNEYIYKFYLVKKDKGKQFEYLQRTMETSSSERQKLLNLAFFHLLKDDQKTAREYYRQAFMLDPTDEDMLEILEELDKECHPLYSPYRFMDKIGGAAIMYISCIGILFLLSWLNLDKLFTGFIILYISFVIYTWIAPVLYKIFVRRRV